MKIVTVEMLLKCYAERLPPEVLFTPQRRRQLKRRLRLIFGGRTLRMPGEKPSK